MWVMLHSCRLPLTSGTWEPGAYFIIKHLNNKNVIFKNYKEKKNEENKLVYRLCLFCMIILCHVRVITAVKEGVKNLHLKCICAVKE